VDGGDPATQTASWGTAAIVWVWPDRFDNSPRLQFGQHRETPEGEVLENLHFDRGGCP
jgi:hypothetical protein